MDSWLSRVHFLAFSLCLLCLLLAACSGAPQVAHSIDKLNLVDADLKAEVFTPGAVLTIAPTQNPTSSVTRAIPTATRELTSTQIAEKPTETLIITSTDSTILVETPQNTEPTLLPQNLSACPAGCTVPPPACLIKGNINNEGVKIYHIPGQDYYNQTKISPEKGERWFCTAAEAESNGWRASKR